MIDLHPPKPKAHRLCLHKGAREVEWDVVAKIRTPDSTETWTPIPHTLLIDSVRASLMSAGLKLGNQTHSISHEGSRYFGLIEVHGKQQAEDYGWVLGLRNSHDKMFPAGIVAGARVYICSNLAFSGTVKLARKHTRHILRDLPQLAGRSIGKLMEHWHRQDERITAYKAAALTDTDAHDMVIRAVDLGACSNRKIPDVLGEWRKPRHREFNPRTAWSLHNAFTEILKGNLQELPKRTEVLHGLFDNQVGLTSLPGRN